MRVGVAMPQFAPTENLKNVADRAAELGWEAEQLGIDSVWFNQPATHDAIVLAAVVGREVPRITVGTAVVPMHPRHPQILASAAKTAQAATHGRFQLGIGLGAPDLLTHAYGLPYPPPIAHLREYLSALRPLLAGEVTPYEGSTLTSRPVGPTKVLGAEPEIPLIVGAMGRQALRVAGELADGTMPFLAGPRTLEEHIVPRITEAAARAGRPTPRVNASVPAIVTDDIDQARAAATAHLAFYDSIPSYRRVRDMEGAHRAVDLALIGDEATVAAGLRRYMEAGATEITVAYTDIAREEDRRRTWQLAGELTRSA
ncbi:TIGR03564 family F420-dependent LLM class oxidoreductase [Streptomyces sp. ME19-01-6]|uniref:TIGR03564 family F420-dependent LLM class oxidoreductase n=1 Tax=Streptomyces sp. ME19-01-6 TaxID=3028686 RepID=UPI00299FF844|nr:TIGR03564 family F420-dependent LLM class oxidoreductase [Streptomyces sp. ME19-01-6]MDX3226694.1 TIGR03564 family F420-dependent LLM class oxidoreductase [Streptomyces sp. ME19-01-6]